MSSFIHLYFVALRVEWRSSLSRGLARGKSDLLAVPLRLEDEGVAITLPWR